MRSFYSAALTGLLLLFAIPSFSLPVQSILRGKITDTSGAPLPGAIIELPDLHTGSAADASGNYQLNNLPSGNHMVTVKLLGFATQTKYIKLSGTVDQDFTLTESILEQQEIIVTGTSHATERRRSTTPIQSISIRSMQENASTNVIDAISKMPGINQLSTGPAISKPVIRGLGYNRIITLNDGIRQEGQQWGDEHGIEIDDYNVSTIEVLKGPASLAYGSDGLAGVINIRSDEPMPQGKIGGRVTANYQTNNGLAAIHAQLGGNQNGITWGAYITQKSAHDYKNSYDGYVYNTRFSNTDYGASIGINKQWGTSRLVFTSFDQHLGIAEGDRDSATGRFIKQVDNNGVAEEAIANDEDGKSYSRAVPGQHIVHQKLAWLNNFYLHNGGHIDVTLGVQQNLRKEYEDVLSPDDPGLSLRLRTLSYDARYVLPTVKGWHISAGINGMHQQNKNKGIEFLIPDYKLFDIGGYVIGRKDIGAWSVSGGLRLDTRSLHTDNLYVDSNDNRVGEAQAGGVTRFTAFSKQFTSPSGSIGVSYAANKQLTLKLNVSSGYRAPNIAELSANGVHEGTIRYEYGNTSLKAENSFQVDLGAEWSSEHVYVNAALFYNYIHNYTFLQKLLDINGNDSIPDVNNEEGYTAYSYTQTSARLFGGELFVDLHPHPLDWLHLENTFSYVQGRGAGSNDSSKYLPNIPPARWLVALRAQYKSIGSFIKNAYIKLELDNYAAQNNIYSAYNTETSSPAYSLLNASVGFDIGNKKKTLFSVVLAGQNLTDKAYQSHLSRLRFAPENYVTGRTGIWNMGRNFSLLVNVPLNFK